MKYLRKQSKIKGKLHLLLESAFHVMASLAQFESSLISQRVKAGMARAKAQGKRIARPPIAKELQAKIIEL